MKNGRKRGKRRGKEEGRRVKGLRGKSMEKGAIGRKVGWDIMPKVDDGNYNDTDKYAKDNTKIYRNEV